MRRGGGGGSLRLRLLAAGGASVLLALALAGVGLVLLFERHVERRVALELEAHLRQLIDGLERAGDGSLQLARPSAEPRFLEPFGGLYWQIAEEPPPAAGGAAELRSRSLWDARPCGFRPIRCSAGRGGAGLPIPELATLHLTTIGGICGTLLVMMMHNAAPREGRPMPRRTGPLVALWLG